MNKRVFYGKYRGKVTDNHDPEGIGRIRAIVPNVGGDKNMNWALPSVPYAGKGVGFIFIPPIDANVWIEFEDGDPDYPIWTGCFWNTGELANSGSNPDIKGIRTESGSMTFDDVNKSITIGMRLGTGS